MFIVLFCAIASVAEPEAELRVGVREVRPFSFIDENQQPSGYSIDLWNAIADELNLRYSFVSSEGISYTLQDMKDGKLDIAIGAITITEEREKIFDFSYSHFHTGLGIMTQANREYSVTGFFSSFFTADRLVKIVGFVLFLLLSAHLIWLAERRGNYSFHRNYFPGIFEGIYWSIVTASTVGYGDYIPKSKLGKLLSVLIIIISLPLFGIFVADFSSYITLHKLRSNINGPQDLDGKRVGVVKGSTSEEYLAREHLAILEGYASSKELFSHLAEGDLDAIVHDLPTLQYYANTEGKGKVKVVGKMFNKQDYAFLYPESSRLNEPVNRTLLKLVENGTVTTLHRKWFGESGGG
jgi:ABC-type amino acid transport substrate-binding protein